MAWDATGKWIPEDDSVIPKLNGLLASDSTYMQTARAAGTRTASRRGLLNSSIAAGAAESAAIAAGAPLASQDAQQAAQKNNIVLEGGVQLSNQTKLNDQQNTAALGLQGAQAQTQLTLQQRESEAAMARQQLQQQGATEQQLREFDQRTAEQVRSLGSQAELQTQQLSSSERQAALAAETNLTQTQISANAQLTGQYLSAFSQLSQDPNIPAETRNRYITEFQRVLSQGQRLIGAVQTAAPTLNWGGGAGATPNYAAYVQNNPDVLAEFQKESGAFGGDIAAFGQFHYTRYGQAEGRPI